LLGRTPGGRAGAGLRGDAGGGRVRAETGDCARAGVLGEGDDGRVVVRDVVARSVAHGGRQDAAGAGGEVGRGCADGDLRGRAVDGVEGQRPRGEAGRARLDVDGAREVARDRL